MSEGRCSCCGGHIHGVMIRLADGRTMHRDCANENHAHPSGGWSRGHSGRARR